MNVLVIAAHPDDEVLGCGGTMARLTSEGHAVSVLILGEGVTSRYDDPAKADPKELQELHRITREVGAFLGVKEVTLAKLPDNRFDTVPLLEIVKIIERKIEEVKPEVVFTQHGGDLNIDHVCTFRAVLTATRPVAGSPVKAVYAYEVGSSTEWSFGEFTPAFRSQVFFDISSTLKKKIQAMAMYESEARPSPHPRSPEAIETLAKTRGSVAGLPAAEAFHVIREIR
jgi:LmbE family N-acetylglucosaminyl deacetylase